MRYAIGKDDAVVDIANVDPSDRHALGPYACPGCGSELIPALSRVRARHFKHRGERPPLCSFETYLHDLGKRTVRDAFRQAIETGRPYPMKVEFPRICGRYEKDLGVTCTDGAVPRALDLTRWFDVAEIERGVDGFVADVLLSSSKSDELMLVEIQVTHECEPEKIAAGRRIVEIALTSEEDLHALRHGLDLTGHGTRHFNFKEPTPVHEQCRRPCGLHASAFFVFRSGKTLVLHAPIHEIAKKRKQSATVHFSLLEEDGWIAPWEYARRYFEATLTAYFEQGIAVKSCLLCRHGALGEIDAIKCFKTGRETGINTAAECPHYRPDSTPAHTRQRYQRSIRFLEGRDSRGTVPSDDQWISHDDETVTE
ncbi:hypothetical protein [Rhodosalinus halophilus]|uniref:hypothetical protein n=1 Tax=Rhodosalinus halophilus TaxID=2259333 RepID=UPI001F2346B6|nr:hypothetical protein [Rhodosalinus halophilus]